MELRQLQYFRTIAAAGSFSRASAQLGIGQPALSRQIRYLEDELGVRLLYRNGRGVFLTDAGSRFLERLQEILLDLDHLAARTKDEAGHSTGVVTIGMPPALTALIAGSLTTRVKKIMPDVQIRVATGLSGHLNEWLLEKRLDMAVVYRGRLSPGIVAEDLLAESLFLVGSRNRGQNAKCLSSDTFSMTEAEKVPMVLPTLQHALRREVERGVAQAGSKLSLLYEIDSMPGIISVVASGQAYSVVPFSGVHYYVFADQLKVWRLVDPEISNQMMLAIRGDKLSGGTMRDLRIAIREEITDQVAAGRLVGRLNGHAAPSVAFQALTQPH